jgi:hypothetical protein
LKLLHDVLQWHVVSKSERGHPRQGTALWIIEELDDVLEDGVTHLQVIGRDALDPCALDQRAHALTFWNVDLALETAEHLVRSLGLESHQHDVACGRAIDRDLSMVDLAGQPLRPPSLLLGLLM